MRYLVLLLFIVGCNPKPTLGVGDCVKVDTPDTDAYWKIIRVAESDGLYFIKGIEASRQGWRWHKNGELYEFEVKEFEEKLSTGRYFKTSCPIGY